MKFYLSVLSFAYFYLFLVSSKAIFAWAKCVVPYMKVVQAQMIQRYEGLSTMYITVVGWSAEFFLIGQNRSSDQRSGIMLEVQFQNCYLFYFVL